MSNPEKEALANIDGALAVAARYSGIDGAHHKAWVIDQMVRALTGCPYSLSVHVGSYGTCPEYLDYVARYCTGDDGPETYFYDPGTPP